MALQSLIEHHFPKIFTAVLRNFCLLFGIAMILERKDHRKFGRLESTLSNSLDDVLFQTWKKEQKINVVFSFNIFLNLQSKNESVINEEFNLEAKKGG